MGKLDGRAAVITGGSTGTAPAGARLFVDEGAHVFIAGMGEQGQLGEITEEQFHRASSLDSLDARCVGLQELMMLLF